MHVRRLTVAALSLLLPFATVACGGDDDKADSTTTSAANTATTAPADGETVPTEPPTTMSVADFDKSIEAFNTRLEEAGDDFCKIVLAPNELNPAGATTTEQAKAVYQAYADVLTRVSDHLPADSGADSAVLKGAAEKIMSDAEADGYDPAKLKSGNPEAFNDPEVAKSMTAVNDAIAAQKCQ